MIGTYRTPEAFRAALEARARKEAAVTGRPLQRVLHVYLMQRFLARALEELGEQLTVKGGMALEIRLHRPRTTKDVDVRLAGDMPTQLGRLRARLSTPGALDALTFTLDVNRSAPDIDGDGVIYEGARFRAQAYLAAKKYGAAFGVDVAVGDPMVGDRELAAAPNLLDIVGAPPLLVPLYPLATHLAEKLHAYTLPRERTNRRTKDLIDLALVASELAVSGAELREALRTTFEFRRSHPLPTTLPAPPATWSTIYPRERDEHGLPWSTIEEVHAEAARFLDPALAGQVARWAPERREWTREVSGRASE